MTYEARMGITTCSCGNILVEHATHRRPPQKDEHWKHQCTSKVRKARQWMNDKLTGCGACPCLSLYSKKVTVHSTQLPSRSSATHSTPCRQHRNARRAKQINEPKTDPRLLHDLELLDKLIILDMANTSKKKVTSTSLDASTSLTYGFYTVSVLYI